MKLAQPMRPLSPLFRVVLDPIRSFFHLEAASGILLAACAAIALAWANSPWAGSYTSLFELPLSLGAGGAEGHFTVRELINDGLMTIFFFLVGLEIKRELATGELRTLSRALMPLIAAAGGMVVPALIYFAFNAGGPGAHGWAIPMATDIAFAIGCVTLLKGRVPHPLVVFLTALAIFDDIGGILVIAIFYGSGIHLSWLLAALGVTAALFLCNRMYVRNGLVYLLLGVALWYCMHHGGIHATIAGVVVGMMVPAVPLRYGREVLAELAEYTTGLINRPEDEEDRSRQLLYIEERLEDIEPPLNRFEHIWTRWVAFGIVPVFALANSGVSLEGMSLSNLRDPVPLGVLLGLFVGKQVGIFLFTWAAIRLRVGAMPGGAPARQLHGVAVVAGIGFTVALFVAQLAFAKEPALLNEAKLGILLGSALSGVVGWALLRFGPVRRRAASAALAE